MKKLIAFSVLCSICIIFTVSASGSAYAHEEIPTYYSAGGGGGGAGGPEIGVICKFIGQTCGSWAICKLLDGILACVYDDPEDPVLTEMPMCECTNPYPCKHTCSCKFTSEGTGPTYTGTHRCSPPAQ